MNTEKFEVLLSVIKTKNLSKTAQLLGYTPSGVSRIIKTLENELGFPLFVRSKKSLTPTKSCEGLLPLVKSFLQSASDIESFSASVCGLLAGTLTVGTSASMYYAPLVKIIKEFNLLYPDVKFNIVEDTSSHFATALEQGKVDFCIMSRRSGDFLWEHLCYDELIIWANKEHPFAKSKGISINQLRKEKFVDIYPNIDTDKKRFFEKFEIEPDIQYTANDLFAYYAMVEAGLGIAVANRNYTGNFKGDVVSVSIDPPYFTELGIATPKLSSLSPAAKSFLDFVKSQKKTELLSSISYKHLF